MHEVESDAVARDLIQLEDRWGAHNYRPLEVVVERAAGVWVYAVDGRRYLDCLSAYSALNQGHCHPRIVQAMMEQMSRVTLTSRAFRNDQLPRFCEELAQICGMQMVLPMNTGAEAVETAIKAVRRWGYTCEAHPARPGRDRRLREQFPRPHHHHHRLLQRAALPRRLRALHAGLRERALRRH